MCKWVLPGSLGLGVVLLLNTLGAIWWCCHRQMLHQPADAAEAADGAERGGEPTSALRGGASRGMVTLAIDVPPTPPPPSQPPPDGTRPASLTCSRPRPPPRALPSRHGAPSPQKKPQRGASGTTVVAAAAATGGAMRRAGSGEGGERRGQSRQRRSRDDRGASQGDRLRGVEMGCAEGASAASAPSANEHAAHGSASSSSRHRGGGHHRGSAGDEPAPAVGVAAVAGAAAGAAGAAAAPRSSERGRESGAPQAPGRATSTSCETIEPTPLPSPIPEPTADNLAAIRQEHKAIKARLRAFELEFEAEHGRKPRKKRDWQPVLADYDRYDALRKAEAEAVAAAGSAK